ncbi:DUF6088 family protein [Limnohabitans sp. 2KL-3]|uniref:DUF6088 family protein n=1 Tax=Limnohabitans sp. 2KL-3 TaxID=1100700 RepID=UPI000A707B67|nr:DUF6088 family protein [Limnohabitans sp. 2KL-3]
MQTSEKIRQAIADKPPGAVFSSADFLSVGSRAAVDQALFRMMKAGLIERVARGLYVTAGQRVDAQSIAHAMAQKTGEKVGLAPAAGAEDLLVVPTSGLSRTVKAAGHTVQFRRMSQRKLQLAASPKGMILLELWTRGIKDLTTLEIQRATGDWDEKDMDSYAALIPAWLRTVIHQANATRKSVKIGLSGAYDWSNPNIKDDVLIGHVLEKHKFEDVARLCFYYGVPKVKRVFKRHAFEPMTSASVSRMLGNISKGFQRAPAKAIQDDLIDGAKVTFHSRNESDRPKAQIAYLKTAPKVTVSEGGFDLLSVEGLLVMKSLVVYDRVKSRDLYDLMVLTRDHGYTLDDIFLAINSYQPIRNKDPEHFKSVVTGVIPLDKNDESFASIQLNVKMTDIYKYFQKLINDYEIRAVQQMRPSS